MTLRSLALVLVFALAPAGALAEDSNWRFHLGASIDGAHNIELSGKGSNVTERFAGGLGAGAYYYVIPRLSVGSDIELVYAFVVPPPETTGFDRLQLTPGARFDITDNLYARAGLPTRFVPTPFNMGLLGAVGYRQGFGGHFGAYAEVGYERYFLAEESRIVIRGGIETHF